MKDLISRGKLLDSLPKNDTVLSLDVRRIVMDAHTTLSNGKGGLNMEWISVKDRLPEDDATYLVYGRNWYGIVVAIYYGDGKWLTCDDLTNITRFVTHWMPLPDIEGIDDET